MTDRVYPSAKPPAAVVPPPAAAANPANPAFPATKAQLYSNARPAYRPQARHRRRSRCCSCCLWTTVAILVVILLIGLAGVAFYLIYRPRQPSFSVTSLKLSFLNTSSPSQPDAKFELSIAAKNPNKNLVYAYDPIAISLMSGDVDLGGGVIPAFVHRKRNTTVLRAEISSSRKKLGTNAKNGVPLKIRLDTKVDAKVGGLKTPNIGVRVSCDGIRVTPPAGKTPATATTAKAKCEVDTRVKIWKWTF